MVRTYGILVYISGCRVETRIALVLSSENCLIYVASAGRSSSAFAHTSSPQNRARSLATTMFPTERLSELFARKGNQPLVQSMGNRVTLKFLRSLANRSSYSSLQRSLRTFVTSCQSKIMAEAVRLEFLTSLDLSSNKIDDSALVLREYVASPT